MPTPGAPWRHRLDSVPTPNLGRPWGRRVERVKQGTSVYSQAGAPGSGCCWDVGPYGWAGRLHWARSTWSG